MKKGEYSLQSEEEIIIEQKKLIEGLEGVTSYYSNDHAVNLLYEVEGRLPDDKEKMLGLINRYLNLSEKDKTNFNLGVRLGYYRRLDDLNNNKKFMAIESEVKAVNKESDVGMDQICHYLRERIV